nr:reverse transcriptase domain-containing protein [Tanacetum cinerariifolium]
MRTRSQSRNNFPQQEASPVIVEPLRIELPFLEDQFQEDPPPKVPMADNRTMAELLQAPTEGYEDTIGMSTSWIFELHQLDTFYNALNVNDQDSLNSAAGGNFLDKMPRECLKIIESKSKVRQSQAKAVVAKVSTSSSTQAISLEVVELKDLVRALLLDKKNQSLALVSSHTPALLKSVKPNCVTCGGSGTLPSNTITNPKEELKGTEVTKDQVQTPSSQSTAPIQPPVSQSKTPTLISEPVVAPVSAPMPNVKFSIPYPLRRDNKRRRDQANEQIEKFYKIFKDMSFEISFTDALILMPKFASTLKALIGNKEKLSEMARNPMSEHCLAAILNKLPRKLRDPGKFLIPCEFPGMDECLALADLGASINLMPFSVWEALLLLELTLICMTLELADRSVSKPIGIAKDVSFKVGVFHFPANFVVVDFEPDPRVPLILGRYFLKTGRALIDVHKGELTLRIRNEAITYDLDQTWNPTTYDDPVVSTTSPTLTPFGDSDFLHFEEADAFLGLEDDLNSPKINPFYYDPEGDILLLETILNSEPLPPLPNHEQYLPSFKKELKVCEAKTVKSFVNEPPESIASRQENQSSALASSSSSLLPQLKKLSRTVLLAVVLTRTKIVSLQAETFIETTSKRSGTLPSNTITNPKEDLKGITTRSGVAYQGPPIPTSSKVVKQGTEVTKDQVQTPSSQSTAPVQHPVIQSETQTPVSEPVVALVSVSIPYPSRRDNERCRDQANEQIEKFYEIFKEMSFEISFTDALILMPKFASTLKTLIGNKEKLSEMARTPMNEHCSTVILNKLPRKLGDPGKFLIPCEFPGMDECLALADLDASINLMPLSVWEGLSLPKLTPTCMTLELADRSVSKPIGIAKDVSVKVRVFHFPADFVVVDFEPDPRVPLILRRCFLKTGRALIDVHKGELTLRIENEAITYNLDQTSRYSANYNQMTKNKIDVIYEMYSQEVLGFSYTTASGNPTPYDDPIVSTTSPTLTPFGDSDFLLFEEADAFLGLEDDPNSPEFNPFYYDPEGDILLLEAILNSEPLPPLLTHEQYLPS